MFGHDSPRLPGIRPVVLAATLPSNKFYLYILPRVWKFFSNLRSDHDKSVDVVDTLNALSSMVFLCHLVKPNRMCNYLCRLSRFLSGFLFIHQMELFYPFKQEDPIMAFYYSFWTSRCFSFASWELFFIISSSLVPDLLLLVPWL